MKSKAIYDEIIVWCMWEYLSVFAENKISEIDLIGITHPCKLKNKKLRLSLLYIYLFFDKSYLIQ